jgi:hypothetical protein
MPLQSNFFTAVINSVSWQASVFVTVNHFHPNLILRNKAEAYLHESTLFTEGPQPCPQILDYGACDWM